MPSAAAAEPAAEPAEAAPAPREDGYVPIADYAVLGDGRTVALVSRDGRIDWWPLPRLDSPPAVNAVLDPRDGGLLEFVPVDPYTVRRRYVGASNVIETTYRTDHGVVSVTDCLSVGRAGLLPWGELVRRAEGIEGEVTLRWVVRPGTRFGSAQPWSAETEHATLLHVGDQTLAVRSHGLGAAQRGHREVGGEVLLRAGERGLLVVTSGDGEPVYVPHLDDVDHRLDRTIASWHDWSQEIRYEGPWREEVVRSALALKCLLVPTGAIAAAATTSLPERIGGVKNYDYRYSWVRDSSFTLDAFIALGMHEEVHAAVSWLLSAIRGSGGALHVFYTLDARTADQETDLHGPGYRGSRPVRSGNTALHQIQLGTFGDLFDTLWRYARHGHQIDPRTGRLVADLADRCADIWATEDSGIWELDELRHYTISKIGCWVALDRACRLADLGAVPTHHTPRWRSEAHEIRSFIDSECWSQQRQSYTFYAGTDDLDAATLLAARTGFDRGDRLAGTVAAVTEELVSGAGVYRYSGMRSEEGAFIACSFWLVDALLALGRREEAEQRMNAAVALANDVGLLSEEVDPDTGELLGNLPQGLSHLSLINSANAFTRRGHPFEIGG